MDTGESVNGRNGLAVSLCLTRRADTLLILWRRQGLATVALLPPDFKVSSP